MIYTGFIIAYKIRHAEFDPYPMWCACAAVTQL